MEQQATFVLDEDTARYWLDEMLRDNASDEAFCEWLRNAKVGDRFCDGEGCTRVS